MPVGAMVLPKVSCDTSPESSQRATAVEIPAGLKREFAKLAYRQAGRNGQMQYKHVGARTGRKG